MSKTKLTPWFVNGEKPVRKGAYETQLLAPSSRKVLETGYSKWNGQRWGNQRHSPSAAMRDRQAGMQDKPWRGLAEKPE